MELDIVVLETLEGVLGPYEVATALRLVDANMGEDITDDD